jgi:TrpR-related protein YerC/YecD
MNTAIEAAPEGQELYRTLVQIRDEGELKLFLEDICAPSELAAIERRFLVAKRLNSGQTYQQILDETKLSSAIVSRVKRVLQYGNGALKKALDK